MKINSVPLFTLLFALPFTQISCGKNTDIPTALENEISSPQNDPNAESQGPRFSNGDGSGDSYIVVLKKAPVQQAALGLKLDQRESLITLLKNMARSYQLPEPKRVFSIVRGGDYQIGESQARELSENPDIAYVEKNQIIHINTAQNNPDWGLDRLDQPTLPLNHVYNYDLLPSTVHAYVIDTGILTTHQEFQGRASAGTDVVNSGGNAVDCNGHGTHVAGTIGGATYGVAKNVSLHAVRVLDCSGSGTFADVIAGIEWVTQNHQTPAVANMSLGGGASQAIDDAVTASIQSGVTYAVAAGNDSYDACYGSPSRVPLAITVGSTDNSDSRSSFSNYGTCVSLFAPGTDIKSSWIGSNSATNTISGTSMATPHVVGVVALYLSRHSNASPAEVKAALVSGGVSGKLSDVGSGSPNIFLNTAFLISVIPSPTPNPTPVPTPTPKPSPSPSPTPPPTTSLQNNVPVTGLLDAKNGEKRFSIAIPSGATKLTINITGGSGDADLYVKSGSQPTQSNYTCRPYSSTSNENCNFNNPTVGIYYILLRAYGSYSGVTLKATYTNSTQKSIRTKPVLPKR